MFINILLSLIILFGSGYWLKHKFSLPHNIMLLYIAQPLVMSAGPIIVFIGGIISTKLVDDPSLSTLPISLMIIGVAIATIPASFFAKHQGRKLATQLGFSLTLCASLIAMLATQLGNFLLFCVASLIFGFSTAFMQQIRFAAIESTTDASQIPKVISILMLSGLFAAFLGPEIALAAKDIIQSETGFTGSFLCLAIMSVLAIVIMQRFQNPIIETEEIQTTSRSLFTIVKQPIFIIAVLTAALGYALMSYLMTATPLSMHHLHGHSLSDTKWVIQSHIAAMFLPSLFTAYLVKKFGIQSLLISGTIIYAGVIIIALSGEHLLHYWWALILLGIGWNFLFLTGTTLLPQSYQANERYKVQALNEFILFGFQAIASLFAGWVLLQTGWHGLVLSCLPFIGVLLVISIYYLKQAKTPNS